MNLKMVLRSGWVRLFLVGWVLTIGSLGYRYYVYEDNLNQLIAFEKHLSDEYAEQRKRFDEQHPNGYSEDALDHSYSQSSSIRLWEGSIEYRSGVVKQYENAPLYFYLWGLTAPPVAALVAWWVVAGFRRNRPR